MDNLKKFLLSNHILTIATVGEPVWIYNVYFTIDDSLNFYFASKIDTLHGKYLQKDNRVAFSVTWVEDWNPDNKKGIQALGVCEKITNRDELKASIELVNKNLQMNKSFEEYSAFETKDSMYKITPSYIKFKDDEGFGPRGFREYNFPL